MLLLFWCDICLLSSWSDVCLYESDLEKQSISDQRQEIKSMVVNMLQNLNYRYSSHNSNIKCVCLTIKYISFRPIQYAINSDVVSSSIVFSDFDSTFLWMYR